MSRGDAGTTTGLCAIAMKPIAQRGPVSNVQAGTDQVLIDIADYVLGYRVASKDTFATARLCLTDTLAGALDALDFEECARLVGPLVPGTIVPNGARVPGTRHELDPATAAFSLGAMIRWLDFNDQFSGRQGSHPSDLLGGILMRSLRSRRPSIVARMAGQP